MFALFAPVLWIVAGVFAYALTLAYFTSQYPQSDHIIVSILTGISGPIGLFVSFFASNRGKHGLQFKPYDLETRWVHFHEKFDCLSREYFEEKYPKRRLF
jgi:hypothetical protein